MAELFSIKAEQAILGLVIDNPRLFSKVAGTLESGDFYDQNNRTLFIAIENAISNHKSFDHIILVDELKKISPASESEWINFISMIINEKTIEENLDKYIDLVKEKKQTRDLQGSLQESVELVSKGQNSISDLIGSVESKIFDITKKRELRDFDDIEKLTAEYKLKLEKITKEGYQDGTRTKISALDEKLGGLKGGEFIIIAARPSMGKTAFSLEIAKNISMTHNVGFFSLEMPAEQLIKRMVSSEAMLSQGIFSRINKATEMDMQKIQRGFDKVSQLHIWIDDSPSLKINELVWKAKKLNDQNKLDIILIDYLQLIETESKNGSNRQQEISEISRQLKALARDLDIPVIALSQLSRRVESKEDKRPQMSDIRESGAIEQDADIIMLLYRDDYYKRGEDGEENTGHRNPASELEVIISKHRNGPTGTVKLAFNLEIGKISSLNSNYKN